MENQCLFFFSQFFFYQDEQETLVLSVTTCGSTSSSMASLLLWSELCTSYPVFVEQHELVVTQLLLTIRDDLDAAVEKRGCSVDWWAAAMRMLCVLPGCTTTLNAPLLFDQVLKIMALCPAGEAGSLAANCGDSTVASIVDKIEARGGSTSTSTSTSTSDEYSSTMRSGSSKMDTKDLVVTVAAKIAPPISLPAVLECTRRAGVLTRQSLCRLVPDMFLLDTNPRVRVRALQQMKERDDDLLLRMSGAIFGACGTQQQQQSQSRRGSKSGRQHDGSDSLHMHDIELAMACAPLVARLAILDRSGACLVSAVERLVWAARVTREGNHLGQVDKIVSRSLDHIPTQLAGTPQLVQFCTSKEGHRWLGRLSRLSGIWERTIKTLVKEGKLLVSKSRHQRSKDKREREAADQMYGPDAAEGERFEVPSGQFADALPSCEVITIEEEEERSAKEERRRSESSGDLKMSSVLLPNPAVLMGVVVEGGEEKRRRDSHAYVHLSNDQDLLRTRLAVEAHVVPSGREGAVSWAGLNAAREEGRWDWTTSSSESGKEGSSSSSSSSSSSMPVVDGVVVDDGVVVSGNSSNLVAAIAFDYSRLPEAPTHAPALMSSGGSKMCDSRDDVPMLA